MKPPLLPPAPVTVHSRAGRSAWTAVAAATGTLAGLTGLAALVVAGVPGLAEAVRSVVSVGLHGVAHTPREALSIAANNVLIAASMLLVAGLAPRLGTRGRLLCDALVLSIVLRSALLVGVVLGSTGSRLLPFLVHLPLEWAGLGVAAGAWLHARQTPLSRRELAALAGLSVALLSIAAATETYATPR